MINEDNKGTCESGAEFCLNVMKHNDSILLSHLIGKDLNARYYVKNKSLNEMIINEKQIANQLKVGVIASILLEEQTQLEKKFINLEKKYQEFVQMDTKRADDFKGQIQEYCINNMMGEME
jgi:hypothetical protein